MQYVIAKGGEFGPQGKTLPEETIDRDCQREADEGSKDAERYDAGDAKAAVQKEDEGVGDKEEGEFGAEDDTGCCYKTEECLRFIHEEVRLYARPLEETPEGNGHCFFD